ncbi:ABC transporter permease [Vagococcus sp.]|uniref:ABC transporter permease n=1 Tax=Vagococcus sp. TaxID=1933889 RepID=UPI002FC76728
MFLAIKEMKYSKLRYTLIVGIIILISYAVFMLSGLANGLADEFKQVIVDWNSQAVVLSEDSNKNLAASQLTEKNLDDVDANKKAPISVYNGAVGEKNKKVNITLFGTDSQAFLLPEMTDGDLFKEPNDIIISNNLAKEGYKIGDTIEMGSDNLKMKVVGIFPETFYTVTPVIYSSLEDAAKVKYGKNFKASSDGQPINAVVTNNSSTEVVTDAKPKLNVIKTDNFIESLPGYSAQNLTLNSMIYFLFFIVTAIIGIFMYVMTLQKTSIFGVMKAQGISSKFIINSIVKQSLMIGVIGIAIGFALGFGTSFILPDAMPFSVALNLWLIYSLILLLVTIIGSLFSIGTVTKVDPMKAIGG